MTETALLKWQNATGECRIHASRLGIAMAAVAGLMPLDADTIDGLGDQDSAWLDQFLYRFSKLQDAMGERLFVDGLLLLGEDFRDKPFIDALNRLEALALIPGRAWWQEVRELRNQVAHEYPDRRDEQAAATNAIYVEGARVLQVLDNFVAAVESKAREE